MNDAAQESPLPENPAERKDSRGLLQKLLVHPIVRIVLGSVLLIGLHPLVGVALKLAASALPPLEAWIGSAPLLTGTKTPLPAFYITTALVALLCFPVYRLFVRWLEKRRPIVELSTNGAVVETAFGMLTGFALFTSVVAVLWLGGYYHVKTTNPAEVLLPVASLSASAAVFEELLFRGVLFRIVEQWQGSWIALAVSALFFGLAHLANPNASLQAALAIAIEAGILLGAAYMATRRMWLVMGLHFAWNFSESGIYGIPVSGFALPGLLQGDISGPELLTGGAFGAENSIVAVGLCLVVASGFLRLAHRRGRIMQRAGLRET